MIAALTLIWALGAAAVWALGIALAWAVVAGGATTQQH